MNNNTLNSQEFILRKFLLEEANNVNVDSELYILIFKIWSSIVEECPKQDLLRTIMENTPKSFSTGGNEHGNN